MAKRRTTTAYVDKEGKLIPRQQWVELRMDDNYRLLTEYKNERFQVFAKWNGEIPFANDIPRSEWKPYELEVFVMVYSDIDGRELAQPQLKRDELACERFKTADEAIEASGEFLKRYVGLTEEEIADTEPLRDADGSKAEHLVTKDEAAVLLGTW